MSAVSAKICGLNTEASLDAAVAGGARFIGFNFYPPSPRSVTPERAAALAANIPPGVAKVGLFVDPDDAALDMVTSAVPLDMVQVHNVTDPQRLAAIRDRTGLPMILAAPLSEAEDIDEALGIAAPAQMILFDAKPAEAGSLPGGNGVAFDWRLLSTRRVPRPWMLAGGLTPENVGAAIALTGAAMVDVASGVESAPGVKDPAKITAFLAAAGIRPCG